MKISYHTIEGNTDTTRGYGTAGLNVIKSLQALGHDVPFDDENAPVQISFCSPASYRFHDGQYKIGYTPWESTELPHGWLEAMNDCDEVWATSPWTANVYKEAGVVKPIYVYEHGVDSRWTPVKRERGDVLRFLHVGEPALRKGGQMALDAFRATFGNDPAYHLTLKAYESHWLRAWHNGEYCTPLEAYKNVSIIAETVRFPELVKLYHNHDVLVYPSYGEGFGFVPLQGLATGMPVISTYNWAPYKNFLNPALKVDARMDRSIWSIHPGNVYYPSYETLKRAYRAADGLFESLSEWHYVRAEKVHADYNWIFQTEKAFQHIFDKFG